MTRRACRRLLVRAMLATLAATLLAPAAGLAQGGAAAAAPPATASSADEAGYSEDEVKAAFLYNFGNYVQWPAQDRSGQTVSIAVLGARSVADELERFVRGRSIQGMPVRVRRLRAVGELNGDEVLFIGPGENRRLGQLIKAVGGSPTLIVTDAPDGLSEGSMINFRLVNRRVRFEVSLPRAQDAGLMLSSRLLSAALRVETTRRRGIEHRPPPTLARAIRPVAETPDGQARGLSVCGPARGRCPSRT